MEDSEGKNSDEVSPSGNSALEPRKAPLRPMHLPDSFGSFPEELPPSAELSPLDIAAVHRIVGRVGEHEFALDYDLLRRQLLWCFIQHNSLEQGTSGPLAALMRFDATMASTPTSRCRERLRTAPSLRQLPSVGALIFYKNPAMRAKGLTGSWRWRMTTPNDEARTIDRQLSGAPRRPEVAERKKRFEALNVFLTKHRLDDQRAG